MIRVENLSFSIGQFRMDGINLNVPKGEYFVLMGKPGSGKTIFLECLCGLNKPDAGKIYMGGEDVTAVEPRWRRIGYVPQDYALFPHLSVEKNISFGLRGRQLSAAEISSRVEANASMLAINHLLTRSVGGLSGGEKQRTALARALAIEPGVLLLDEPVSALDENTRESVCMDLRRVQSQLGITTIHVSHVLEEAFSVAERVAILRDGAFEQIGTPDQLLHQPINRVVADFMRFENIFSGRAVRRNPASNSTRAQCAGVDFVVRGIHQGNMEFAVRPENIQLKKFNTYKAASTDTLIPVRIDNIVNRGIYVRLNCRGAVSLVVHMPRNSFRELDVCEGDELLAAIRMRMIHVFG